MSDVTYVTATKYLIIDTNGNVRVCVRRPWGLAATHETAFRLTIRIPQRIVQPPQEVTVTLPDLGPIQLLDVANDPVALATEAPPPDPREDTQPSR